MHNSAEHSMGNAAKGLEGWYTGYSTKAAIKIINISDHLISYS